MGADRGQDLDVATRSRDALEQPAGDQPGARVQPGVVRGHEQHAPSAEDVLLEDPVEMPEQLGLGDGSIGAPFGEQRGAGHAGRSDHSA